MNTLQPELEVDEDGTDHLLRRPAERRRRTTRRCGSTGSPSACTPSRDGALTRVERVETDIAGARTEVDELVGLQQPDLCWSTTTT